MSNLVFLLIFIFWILSIFIVLKFGHDIGSAKICYSPRGKQDRKLRVYISGAMSSDPEHPDHFHRTALALIKEGYTVVCPTCLPEGLDYADYLHIDFAMIDVCDILYLMHNWTESPGAAAEKIYAESTGKKIIVGRHKRPHLVLQEEKK